MPQELSLFDDIDESPGPAPASAPLAARLRPDSLTDYIGHQEVVTGSGTLSHILESGRLASSFLLWGPPGSGKTTLAHILAKASGQRVHHLSAVTAGLKDIRAVIEAAEADPGQHLLFIDEIHRFNKTQQDALLPVVESGRLRLLGATTENPYFELRKALLSRCRVVKLEKLKVDDLVTILKRALQRPEGLASLRARVDDGVLEAIAKSADGDARSALNLLELAVGRGRYQEDGTLLVAESVLDSLFNDQNVAYHKSSDRRYDLVSAFIKSIRASKPDASLYWLASMLAGGEDPNYILRRLLISASEDVGLADPSAIAVVTSCAEAFRWVGLPEGKYHLCQATLYLATTAKSDTTKSLFAAEAHIQRHGPGEVPLHLRDGSYSGAAQHQIGQGYVNPHRTGGRTHRPYLPEGMEESRFYSPSNQGYERTVAKRMGERR